MMIHDPKAFKLRMLNFDASCVNMEMIDQLQLFEESSVNAPGSTRHSSMAVHTLWIWVCNIANSCGLRFNA